GAACGHARCRVARLVDLRVAARPHAGEAAAAAACGRRGQRRTGGAAGDGPASGRVRRRHRRPVRRGQLRPPLGDRGRVRAVADAAGDVGPVGVHHCAAGPAMSAPAGTGAAPNGPTRITAPLGWPARLARVAVLIVLVPATLLAWAMHVPPRLAALLPAASPPDRPTPADCAPYRSPNRAPVTGYAQDGARLRVFAIGYHLN